MNQWCFFWSITLLIKAKRNIYSVLKGSYTAIFVSVIVHVLLLLALIFSAEKTPKSIKQDKPKVTVIKSFLYSAPKKTPPKKVIAKKVTSEKFVVETKPAIKPSSKKAAPKAITSKPTNAKELSNKKLNKLPNKPSSKEKSTRVTNAVKSDTSTTKNKVSGTSRGSFSSYDRLSRLRNKLDKQQREQAFTDLTQQRSASVMDGEPFPVPKTIVPLTTEQKYIQNTSKSHVGSITKNDNGTCTIHREQILGSPVEATTSYFGCGESKFDKSFREHMQKVQAKLGK